MSTSQDWVPPTAAVHGARPGRDHVMAADLQPDRGGLADVRVVVDEQHSCHGSRVPFPTDRNRPIGCIIGGEPCH